MHDVKRRGLKKALQEHYFALLPEEARDRFSSCFPQMLYICLKVSVLLRASIAPLTFREQTNISCQEVFEINNITKKNV